MIPHLLLPLIMICIFHDLALQHLQILPSHMCPYMRACAGVCRGVVYYPLGALARTGSRGCDDHLLSCEASFSCKHFLTNMRTYALMVLYNDKLRVLSVLRDFRLCFHSTKDSALSSTSAAFFYPCHSSFPSHLRIIHCLFFRLHLSFL